MFLIFLKIVFMLESMWIEWIIRKFTEGFVLPSQNFEGTNWWISFLDRKYEQIEYFIGYKYIDNSIKERVTLTRSRLKCYQ